VTRHVLNEYGRREYPDTHRLDEADQAASGDLADPEQRKREEREGASAQHERQRIRALLGCTKHEIFERLRYEGISQVPRQLLFSGYATAISSVQQLLGSQSTIARTALLDNIEQ